eukprot:10840-Heterococcus_DN1.PRE.1
MCAYPPAGRCGGSTGSADSSVRCSSLPVRSQAPQALRGAQVPGAAVWTAAARLHSSGCCHSAALRSSNSSAVHSATVGAAHGNDGYTGLHDHQ